MNEIINHHICINKTLQLLINRKQFTQSRLLILLFTVLLSIGLQAQTEKDSLILHERSGGPWKKAVDTLKLSKQTFSVRYGSSIYFSGEIHIEPTIYIYESPQGMRLSIQPNITATVLEDKPLGNRLWLTYRLARQHLDYPNQHIAYIKVHFNKGGTLNYTRNMLIPESATKINSLEIKWKGDELPVTRVLFWGTMGIPSGNAWKWAGGALIIAGGAALYARQRRRLRLRKKEPENDKEEEEETDVLVSLTRIDPDKSIDHLHAFELIRIKAVFQEDPTDKVEAQLISTTGNIITVSLKKSDSDKTYLSEPIELILSGFSDTLETPSLQVNGTDALTVKIKDNVKVFSVTWPELPGIPDVKGIRILRNGPEDVTIDPQAGIDGELSVRVMDEFDEPIANIRIAWEVKGFDGDMPCTVTDKDGITKLSFVAAANGGFIPVDDDLPIAEKLKATKYTLIPVFADETLLPLVTSEPITFTVDLVAPAFLNILNHTFEKAPYLIKGEKAYFQVVPGRGDAVGVSGSLPVKITEPDGDDEQITLTETKRKGWYENLEDPWEATHNEDGDKVRLHYLNHQTSVPVYENIYNAQIAQLYPTLNKLRKINLTVRQSGNLSPELQKVLHLKGKMLANAIAWLDEPHPIKQLPIAITAKYLELLELSGDELGSMQDIPVDISYMPQALKGTHIVYSCNVEATAINHIISTTARRFFDRVNWLLISTVVEIIAAPQIGAYTAYTGLSLEGKKVGTLERFAGGAMALTALMPLGFTFRRYAKAAKALERQAVNHLDWYAATMEKAYTQQIFAVKAATCQQLQSQMANLFKNSVRAEQLIQKQATKALDDVKGLEARITKLEQDIKNTQAKLQTEIERRANNPSLKPITKKMKSNQRGIIRKEKSLELRRQELLKARNKHKKHLDNLNELYLGRELEKKHLLKIMEEELLPAYNDKFGGRKATDLYQAQAEADLLATDTAWAGVTKRKIHSPYRQTRWGSDFKVAKKKTVAPEADHLHMKDLKGADSKYWTFWPEDGGRLGNVLKDLDTVTHRVRQAVNSIEKGRQIQYNILSKRSGQEGMQVWKQVWDLDFYIITPIPVPESVQNMIKASAGGAGRNIKFTVIPARLDQWAKSIP
jgi:hypothetical protein